MKILLVSFCPPYSAIADNFLQLANDLSKYVEISLLCPEQLEVKAYFHEVYRIAYTKKDLGSLFSAATLKLLYQIRRANFDLIFFFNQHVLNILISVLLCKTTQIMWWHEPTNGMFPSVYRHPKFRYWNYALNDLVLTSKSARLILACEAMKLTILPKLIDKIEIVPLPFLESFSSETVTADEPETPVDLVFFGNIAVYKGLHVLAEALNILYSQHYQLRVAILGKGDLRMHCPLLLELAERYSNRILIHNDHVSNDVITQVVRSSKAVILPYLTATGTNVIQIAYQNRKPVIATKVGCFINYVVDGSTGLLVEPGDPAALATAITKLTSNIALSHQLGENAYKFLKEQFMQPIITQKLLRIFEQFSKDN